MIAKVRPNSIDALTRRAAEGVPLSRRASLLLAAAGLAAEAVPAPVVARKKKSKRRRKERKKLKKLAAKQCKAQVSRCFGIAPAICGDDPVCNGNADRCCPLLSACNINEFLICLLPST